MWFNVVSFDEYIVSLTRIFDLKRKALLLLTDTTQVTEEYVLKIFGEKKSI
jgi:hypothetical protein